MKLKLLILLSLSFVKISVFSTEIEDSIKKETSFKSYSNVDHLDSLLQNWFYYTGRDTVSYLRSSDRFSFEVELEDSIFEKRIKNIVTPLNLSYNSKVQQYLNRYVKNGRWIAPRFLGLSHQYFPLFEEKLDAYGIPLELKYLPVIESALNPRAKSRVGAMGLWQFMYKTGLGMGLEINSFIDERIDPEKSTDAACRYLKFLHSMYGDWTLALAAYNAGPGTVNKAIRRAGGKTSYWEIYPYLPKETRNYIPGFIAVTYLFTYYELHGFKPEKFEFITDFDTVMIKKELHFAQLDSVVGIPIGETRELNPQYKLDIVPAKAKQYPLRIRREFVGKFIELEDSVYKYNDSIYFNPVLYKKINEKYIEKAVVATQPSGTAELKYTVKSGDVIGLIASWYNVNLANLKAWNGMANNNLRVGRELKVYVPKDSKDKYEKIDKMSFEAKQKSIGRDVKNKDLETPLDADYEYYTVKSGDNPFNISQRYEGVSANDIMKLNNISKASSLKIGQKLKIRKKQT